MYKTLKSLYYKFLKKDFRLPTEPYGNGQNERVIEIPWAISKYRGEKRVLEVGPTGAQPEYLEALRKLKIEELHGIDITESDLDGFIMNFADIRDSGYQDNFFDLILCISTLEHVGRDNSWYKPDHEQDRESDGDIKGLRELERICKPGGRILLTFPYGRFHDYGWFVHYDKAYLDRLLDSTSLKRLSKEMFVYREGGWFSEFDEDKMKDLLYQQNGAPNATGVVCLVLGKPL